MTIDRETLLDSRVSLPQHVVHRSFVAETVVLNLRSGTYYGLNRTAGRMLDELEGDATVREAAAKIAGEYGEDQAAIEADLVTFCLDLLDRELVEIVDDGPA
jgi:hypothetical protein